MRREGARAIAIVTRGNGTKAPAKRLISRCARTREAQLAGGMSLKKLPFVAASQGHDALYTGVNELDVE